MSVITCTPNIGFIGLIFFACLPWDLGISGQTEATQQNATLEVGTRSILPCHIQRRSYSVEWRRQRTSETEPLVSLDTVFGTREGPGYEAELFNITEDYSLVINDVKVQDEGLYLCKVFDYETGTPILNWTQVFVQAFPDEPFPIIRECMWKDSHPGACILKVNSTSKLTCLVKGYYPYIELYFLHGSEKVVSTTYEWKNTDGTKNKNVTILISISDEPYKCVASGFPGIVGNRTVTVIAQTNASPQRSNTVKIVMIVFTVVVPILAGACLFIVFKRYRRNDRDKRTTLNKPVKFRKIFMDPIHGNMKFRDELLIKIIDTPQFQRLRNIKQLGGCYYVYPGAAHNRFEHSLGVCQLAGDFIRTLRNNQPELKITDMDIRRVEIAGLCHDLGHGPLSRVFDKYFIPRRSRKHRQLEGLKNKVLSTVMFDHLIQENNLRSEDLNDEDITEIKRMIQGVKDDDDNVAAEKRFLYQIVTSKSTGIDVDKFDYFARDCHQLGITNDFDYKRCVEFARVIRLDNGRRILCFRDKEADNLYKMFHVRCMLHRRVYQHRASTAIEHMIVDAFEKADEATDDHGEKFFKIFPAKDGSKLTMTDTLIKQDMHAYTYMTDNIVERILSSREKELEKAREILESVQKRDKTKLYRLVHEVLISSEQAEDFEKKWKTSRIENLIVNATAGLKKSMINVQVVTINYGQKDKNPINNVHFYSKSDQDKAVTLKDKDISLILPKAFQETYIRIYCKKYDDQLKSDIKTNFENWYEKAIESTKDALERERGMEGFGYLIDHTSLNLRQTEEIGMGEAAPVHNDVRMTRSKHAKFKKVFMDPIHGSMVFHDELLIKIIDTPQFQRLRRIKQLGGCYYVYPGAAHNRFEHSLGVCHLAGEFIRTLHRNQPELNITPKDIRRVEIAGLCHDLGHGPLSHVFEKDFIPRLACKHPERQELKGLKHEDLSAMMFDHLIHQNDLKSEDFNDSDITEIKRMMKGVKDDGDNVPAEKGFLYQIVANKPTGIDVDKWDYFARDCHHLGIPNSFDHKRCMEFAKVIQQSSGRQILCFRDEEADNLYQMFYVRYMLHRRVYQHRVPSIIEHMIMDAFKEAEDARDVSGAECFKIFPSKDGSKLTMTETLEKKDMHAYTYMTDSIQERILSTTEKGLEKARGILENVQKRDKTNMYRFVHEVLIPSEYGEDFLKKWKEEQKIVDKIVETSAGLEDYLIVKVVKINYGQKGKNPINNVHFYSKSDQDKAVTLTDEEISLILPKAFQEIFIRVYCKKLDAQRNADVKAAFEKWYKSEIDSLKRLKQDALKRERGQKTPGRRNVGTSSTRDREEQRPSTEPSGKSVQRNLFGDSSDNKGRGNDEQECKQTLLTDMV